MKEGQTGVIYYRPGNRQSKYQQNVNPEIFAFLEQVPGYRALCDFIMDTEFYIQNRQAQGENLDPYLFFFSVGTWVDGNERKVRFILSTDKNVWSDVFVYDKHHAKYIEEHVAHTAKRFCNFVMMSLLTVERPQVLRNLYDEL